MTVRKETKVWQINNFIGFYVAFHWSLESSICCCIGAPGPPGIAGNLGEIRGEKGDKGDQGLLLLVVYRSESLNLFTKIFYTSIFVSRSTGLAWTKWWRGGERQPWYWRKKRRTRIIRYTLHLFCWLTYSEKF